MQNNLFAGTLPIQGSDVAAQWDMLYWFLFWLSAFFFVLVVGAMIVFAVKYRHSKVGTKTKYLTGSHALEGVFVVVPTILLMVIFFWGYKVYRNMVTAPADSYEIRVIA
ncbi:MAG: cytochrome c oxidase subunit II transmembrane domain-containing protein, partial [Bdellovibrionota bacterium]